MDQRFAAAFPDKKPGSIAVWKGQIRRFLNELAVGDDSYQMSEITEAQGH